MEGKGSGNHGHHAVLPLRVPTLAYLYNMPRFCCFLLHILEWVLNSGNGTRTVEYTIIQGVICPVIISNHNDNTSVLSQTNPDLGININ